MKDELINKFIKDIKGKDAEQITRITDQMLDEWGKREWNRGYSQGYHSKAPRSAKQKALRLIQGFIDPASPGSETNKMLGHIYTDLKEQL